MDQSPVRLVMFRVSGADISGLRPHRNMFALSGALVQPSQMTA